MYRNFCLWDYFIYFLFWFICIVFFMLVWKCGYWGIDRWMANLLNQSWVQGERHRQTDHQCLESFFVAAHSIPVIQSLKFRMYVWQKIKTKRSWQDFDCLISIWIVIWIKQWRILDSFFFSPSIFIAENERKNKSKTGLKNINYANFSTFLFLLEENWRKNSFSIQLNSACMTFSFYVIFKFVVYC
jgi:hypothetical protein